MTTAKLNFTGTDASRLFQQKRKCYNVMKLSTKADRRIHWAMRHSSVGSCVVAACHRIVTVFIFNILQEDETSCHSTHYYTKSTIKGNVYTYQTPLSLLHNLKIRVLQTITHRTALGNFLCLPTWIRGRDSVDDVYKIIIKCQLV